MTGPILLCMGTRAEVIKLAPVYHALKRATLPVSVLHTGHCEEMAWPLYGYFDMRPERIVKLVRRSEAEAHLGALLLEELDGVMMGCGPSAVLVQGGGPSALMAALAAFYRRIPVGHIDAGLRSGKPFDPFPEEKNRELIARLAEWHFVSTEQAESNLLREGIDAKRIHRVGSTAAEATQWGALRAAPSGNTGGSEADILPESLAELPRVALGRQVILVTVGRRENWGDGVTAVAGALRSALQTTPDLCVVWPVHPHPRVQRAVYAAFDSLPRDLAQRVFLCEPLHYPALVSVLKRAWLTMTDSGGLQDEAVSLRVPVFVLREATDRPELIASGAGVMVGCNARTILDKLATLRSSEALHRRMRQSAQALGDGQASDRIARVLASIVAAPDLQVENA